jgi:PhnB protein
MTNRKQTVFAHLVVDDAAAALEFYKSALGATEAMRMPAKDGKRLLHAQIEVNAERILLQDDFPEFREGHSGVHALPPKLLGGTSARVHLIVPNCDEAVKQAEAAGAKVILPPMDGFWGDRYAQVLDPFGHIWSFAHPLQK